MKTIKPLLIAIVFIATLFNARADKLKTGFERLRIYDYFQAKQLFEESLKKKMPGAAYGLSVIYSLSNNPFYNLDSARRYILLCDSSFTKVSNKQREYYLLLGVSSLAIQSQKDSICRKALIATEGIATVEAYNGFMKRFGFCNLNQEVIMQRNALAFELTKSKNTADAYREFLKQYPDAKEFSMAKAKLDERTYTESTAAGTLDSYIRFLNDYPQSPYRLEAEKNIYALTVRDKSIEQYHQFVTRFPDNHFVEDAWREIYSRYMKDYDEQVYENFKKQYPDYPFKDELQADYKLQKAFFIPVAVNNKYGYMDEEGQMKIKPAYTSADYFSEGLAVAETAGKFGYIDKSGKVVIDFRFDDAESFSSNVAVVKQGDFYGLINRKGEFVIQPKYDELSEPVEGICMALLNDKWGFFSKSGTVITECKYDFAQAFRNGFTIVGNDEHFGLINATGATVVEIKYDELYFFNDSLMRAYFNAQWGIINTRGETVQNFIYEAIGELKFGRAMIAIDNHCGFLNERGKVELPIAFQFNQSMLSGTQYSEGFILMKQKNKKVLINNFGEKINLAAYEDFLLPTGMMIPVKKKRLWGFADDAGKIRIPCTYSQVSAFEGGVAFVKNINGFFGIIDFTGKPISEFVYDNLEWRNGFIIVTKAGQKGLLNKSAQQLIPVAYEKIDFINPYIAELTKGGNKIYFNLNLKKIIVAKD